MRRNLKGLTTLLVTMVTLRQPTQLLDRESVKQCIDEAIALVEKDVLRVDRKVSLCPHFNIKMNS